MITRLLIILGLVGVLKRNHRPWLVALLYAVIKIFFLYLSGDIVSFFDIIVGGIIVFVISFLYFWLLDKFEEKIFWWIVILVVGFFLV
jgi:uncharacterized membrane protein YjjP (DUF1212 family)